MAGRQTSTWRLADSAVSAELWKADCERPVSEGLVVESDKIVGGVVVELARLGG